MYNRKSYSKTLIFLFFFFPQAMVKDLNEQVNAGEEEKYGIEFKLNLVINEVSIIIIILPSIDLKSVNYRFRSHF